MKLAYVCADPGVPAFGRKGASVHMAEVLRALLKAGTDLTLFVRRVEATIPDGFERINIVPLGLPPPGPGHEAALLASGGAVRAAIESRAPFDAIYERHSLWSAAPMEYARDTGIPGLLEVNAPLVQEQSEYRTLLDPALAIQAARRSFGAASAVLAVSDEVAHYVKATEPACRRVDVLPNGVDLRRFSPMVQPSLPAQGYTVGFVGTLKPWHGVDTLVRAFAKAAPHFPLARLLIVGDGPERGALEQLARSLGIRPVLTGSVHPDQVPGLVASMDVCVAPYPQLKNFYFSPLKLFEYMAAGRAVVAARAGQVAKILTDGVDGLLYKPGDEDALAAALIRLHEDPAQRTRLGSQARRTAQQRYSWDQVASHILALAATPRHAAGLDVAETV